MLGIAGSILALAPMVGTGAPLTIEASFREQARRPTALYVEFRNPGAQPVSITAYAHVRLTSAIGDFHAPFDLQRFAPIGPNARTTLDLDAGGARRVVIDLSDLLWGKSISSDWPSEAFAQVVSEGRYSVTVELEGADRKRIVSTPVEGIFTVALGAAPSR